MNCAACNQLIARGELLQCTKCTEIFHFKCLNMSTAYYIENKHLLMSSWHCPKCGNATRRNKNDNTPVRKQHQNLLNETTMSVDDQIYEDSSVIGNTPQNDLDSEAGATLHPPSKDTITFDKFSHLLETKLNEKLEKNKQEILAEIKSTVQNQIDQAVHNLKTEMTQTNDLLQVEQTNQKDSIIKLENKIEKLEQEKDKLRKNIQDLQKRLEDMPKNEINGNTKKIVIYGLNENYSETEHELESRIIYAFTDILGVDLSGYIEDVSRIGRRGPRRPVQVELISKKMTKYILSNTRQFKSTGLYVTEYLDTTALKERKALRDHLNQTRQNYKENDTSRNKSSTLLTGTMRKSTVQSQYNGNNQKNNRSINYRPDNQDQTFLF